MLSSTIRGPWAEGLLERVLWWWSSRIWKLKSCQWQWNYMRIWDWPRMLKAKEVCSSIRDEWTFAVTTISTSWQGLLERCQQRESTYGTSFTPFQSGQKSGRGRRDVDSKHSRQGRWRIFKKKMSERQLFSFGINQRASVLLVLPAVKPHGSLLDPFGDSCVLLTAASQPKQSWHCSFCHLIKSSSHILWLLHWGLS